MADALWEGHTLLKTGLSAHRHTQTDKKENSISAKYGGYKKINENALKLAQTCKVWQSLQKLEALPQNISSTLMGGAKCWFLLSRGWRHSDHTTTRRDNKIYYVNDVGSLCKFARVLQTFANFCNILFYFACAKGIIQFSSVLLRRCERTLNAWRWESYNHRGYITYNEWPGYEKGVLNAISLNKVREII